MSDRFGPNTAQVEAFLGVVRGLSGEQVESARVGRGVFERQPL